MKAWGDRWLGSDGPEVTLIHKLCATTSHPAFTCDHCNTVIRASDMTYTLRDR